MALVIDPMLATGELAVAALESFREWGVAHLKLLTIIAAPDGVGLLGRKVAGPQTYVCAIDECLNAQKFILPGLGDAGDRRFNTIIDRA